MNVEVTELALAFPLFRDADQETSLGRRHQVNLILVSFSNQILTYILATWIGVIPPLEQQMLLFNTDRMQRRFEPLASTTCERFRFLGICFVPMWKHTVSMKKKRHSNINVNAPRHRRRKKAPLPVIVRHPMPMTIRWRYDADDYTMTMTVTV